MSIATLPQLLAGLQPTVGFFKFINQTATAGRPTSFWYNAGCPAQGGSNTTLTGATYSNVGNAGAGQINRSEAPGGTSAYLARFVAQVNHSAVILLMDRIWDNGGITITSTAPQTINSPQWPARDANGQTNGVGIFLAVDVSATTGTGTPTITMSYTNSNGLAGQTATNQDPTANAAQIGDMFRMKLAAGDVGVQSVQSITLSATWTSGTIHAVAYRLIAVMECVGSADAVSIDPVTSGLPILYPGTFLFMATVTQSAVGMSIAGSYTEAQG